MVDLLAGLMTWQRRSALSDLRYRAGPSRAPLKLEPAALHRSKTAGTSVEQQGQGHNMQLVFGGSRQIMQRNIIDRACGSLCRDADARRIDQNQI